MAEIISKVVILALMSSLVNTPTQAAPANNKATADVEHSEAAAIKAAEKTLKLIDEQQYAESWNESAAFFKKAVKKKQWIAAMQQSRKPFGQLISRELLSAKYMTQLPNAPAGEYVVIQFKTSFENKKSAIETFTPMFDQDGVWRMSGYFIK